MAAKISRMDSQEFRSLFTPELNLLHDLFKKNGFELRIAGGAVRDLLMGVKPADVDFATTATPEQMQEIFGREGIRMLHKKGEEHGTITCRLNDKENFEITTLRIDRVCDGRHAEVEFTTDWYLDSLRRDLTINSMFLGLDGTVYDFFDGMKDLQEKRIAFVGNTRDRIREDYLRILRYFRFYGRIAEIPDAHEPETLKIISDEVKGLGQISGERIWVELKKIVTGNHSGPIMRRMLECGIGPFVGFPSDSNIEEYEIVWNRGKIFKPLPMTFISALLSDENQVYKFDVRLKISKQERILGVFIVMNREKGAEMENTAGCSKFLTDLMLDSSLKRDDMAFQRSLELAKYLGRSDVISDLNAKWELDTFPPVFPVSGVDVGRAGVAPGPAMKKVLMHLQEIWKDSNYLMNKDELLSKISNVDLSDCEMPKKKIKH